MDARKRAFAVAGCPARGRTDSPHGVEHLAAGGDRLCRHQHEGDDAGRRALVHPVVDGAALHRHVARLEVHAGAVDLHVDLARNHRGVVDRIGAMVARADSGTEAHHPEHGAVGKRGADLAGGGVGAAVVVYRKVFARPDHGGLGARPRLGDVLTLSSIDTTARPFLSWPVTTRRIVRLIGRSPSMIAWREIIRRTCDKCNVSWSTSAPPSPPSLPGLTRQSILRRRWMRGS